LTTTGTDLSASLLINGIAITGSSFNGTVNGPLTVSGLSSLNGGINVGGTSQNPNCNINNLGVLTTKGIIIPPNSVPGTINVNSGKFAVNSNGTLQLLNTTGTIGLLYDGTGTKINDSLTLGTSTTPASLTVNGPASTTAITVTNSTFNINRPTINRMKCFGNGDSAVQIEDKSAGTAPYLTVGDITGILNPQTYATVIRGDVFVSGVLTSSGVSSSKPNWSDISSAVAVQFSGTGSVSYLDVSAGITAGTPITGLGSTNTVRANYNNFNGNYLSNNATSAEVIRSLNMVISQQNRIIAALLNRQTSGP
jgi:hypothetical protein